MATSRERAENLLKLTESYSDDREFIIDYIDRVLQTVALRGYNKGLKVKADDILDAYKVIDY